MTGHLFTIARLELLSTARLRWIRLLSVAFGLLAVAAAYSTGSVNESSGPDGFARTTIALMPVVLALVPLAALVLGVAGQATEAGSESFLFGQPVSRRSILIGRWLGESAALGAALLAGLGAGGGFIAFNAGLEGVWRYVFFACAAVGLAAIFLALAAAVASATEKRMTALALATFVWCFFVLLYDGVALSAAGWLTGSIGGRVLFTSVFGNPVDLVRIAVLSISGTPNVLGAAGDAWLRFLGGTAAAGLWLIAALAAWTIGPLAAGVRALRARDL